MTPLPIDDLRTALRDALQDESRVIIRAPTGSGKSTRVPGFVADDIVGRDREVVVLEPRRLAARMLARRVAQERGVSLGAEVGYQVRFDSQVSRDTRIRFVTEGVLLRQLLSSPDLSGVGAIVFDEFHERHLDAEVMLALALRLQQERRPDLKLLVMSATLASGSLRERLAPCAVIESEGRTFPVEISYRAAGWKANPRGGEIGVWDAAAKETARLLESEPDGDVLVFMPGAFEIRRTLQALEGFPAARRALCLPLHGELSPEEQDRVVGTADRRKVIVATNIAETSLTIPGVRIVVDSGLARVPAYDPRRGLSTLLVQKISQASAEQRAGRAGRTAPGHAVRLWSERDHTNRPAFEVPELARLDLAETVLLLKAHGIQDVGTLPWLESPPEESLARAVQLLEDLGAIDPHGNLTPRGARMSRFPLEPRLSRLLLEGIERGCLEKVCLAAAVLQGRSLLLRTTDDRVLRAREEWEQGEAAHSDVALEVAALREAIDHRFSQEIGERYSIHLGSARQAAEVAKQFHRVAEQMNSSPENGYEKADGLRRCLLAAYADQLAKRREAGTLSCDLIHGRRGLLRRESVARDAMLFVTSEVEEREVRGEVSVLLGMNTAVEEDWLRELDPEALCKETAVRWDATQKRVVAVTETRFRDLVLTSRQTDEVPLDASAELLAEQVRLGNLKLKNWDESVEGWIRRLNTMARRCPDLGFPELAEDDRAFLVTEICHGARSYREIKDRAVLPAVKGFLSKEQATWLESLAPERIELASGRAQKLRYEEDGTVVLSATVQQLYGMQTTPTIAEGRIPVRIEILAPNRRPVQITDDLGSFWTGAYLDVKKQLRGRYPKHEWR